MVNHKEKEIDNSAWTLYSRNKLFLNSKNICYLVLGINCYEIAKLFFIIFLETGVFWQWITILTFVVYFEIENYIFSF